MIKKLFHRGGVFSRCVLYTLALVLWLIPCVLALELFALGVQLRMERNNPIVHAFKNKESLPVEEILHRKDSNVKRQWPMPHDAAWRGDSILFDLDESMRQVLDWGVIDVQSPAKDSYEREKAFLSLTPSAREAYAQLNGVMALKIDGRYRIHEVYGVHKNYFNRPFRAILRAIMRYGPSMAPLREAITQTLQDGQPRSCVIVDKEGNAFTVTCVACEDASKSGGCVYIFADIHPETIVDVGNATLPEESYWEIPGYRFKASHRSSDSTFYTNAFGFRDDPVTLPKPEGVFRIVCVGGSTTEEGPENDKSYPKLLERYLKRSLSDCQVEVINAGTSGAFLHVNLLRFNEYMALEPDLIILHVGVNDLVRRYLGFGINFIPRQSRFVRLFFPSLMAPSVTNFIDRHYEYMGFPLEIFTSLAKRCGIEVVYASMAFPDHERISRNARQYYEYMANSNWHLPAFSLPVYNTYINASNTLLKRLSDVHGAHYIAVDAGITGSTNIFGDFCHMTDAGIELKARVIGDDLLPLLRERLSCAN